MRVSTQEQVNEGVSLPAQRERVAAYAALQGLELVDVFADEGVSAGEPLNSRPAGASLLSALASGRVHHVICVKLDRAFRDAADCLHVTREWDRAGVALHLVDLGGQTVNTASAMGRFMLTVMAAAAEMELNLIRERTVSALAYKRARGERLGGDPLGLSTPAPGTPWQPVDAELAAVDVILREREAGTSFREIVTLLQRSGIRTKRGGRWSTATLHAVWRRREVYRALLGATSRGPSDAVAGENQAA